MRLVLYVSPKRKNLRKKYSTLGNNLHVCQIHKYFLLREKIQKITSVAAERYGNEINEYLGKRFLYSKYSKQPVDRNSKLTEFSEESTYIGKPVPDIPNVKTVFDNNTR